MIRPPSKKIIIVAAVLLSAGILLAAANLVLAQAPPVAPAPGGRTISAAGSVKAFGLDVTSTVLAVLGVLALLQAVLTQLLALVSFFLDNLFKFNTILLPNAMPVVHSGWTAMRDIANAIFILILLWIAFTIIFNIENLGGKKLLARLIIIAILINFSLTMVSFVFGFANALAKPFQKAINTTDIAGLIVGKTNLHNITSQLNNSEKTTLESYGIDQEELDRTYIRPQEGMSSVDQQKFLPFAVGPEEARAQAGGAVAAGASGAGCGIGALVGGVLGLGVATPVGAALGCAGGSIIAAIAQAAISSLVAAGTVYFSWKMILNLAVSNLFMILTIFALAAAGILLLGRIIAMVFVAVLAPTAFLAYAIPGKYGQKYWDMWLDSLLKWSFVAPAFYFLFWVSLLVLDKMQSTIPPTKDFSGNTLYIFTLIIFLGFLFASITIARKMGITVADSFIKWGQKAGWGALGFAGGLATSGLKNLGSAAFRRVAPEEGRVQRLLRGAAEYPGLRVLSKIPAQAIRQQQEILKKEVSDRAAKLTNLSKPEKIAEFRRAFLAKDIAAAAQALGADIKDLTSSEMEKALSVSAGFGLEKNILRIRPDLITGEKYGKEEDYKRLVPDAENFLDAKKKFIMRIKPNEFPDIAKEAFERADEETKNLFLQIMSPEHWKQVARSKNQALLGAMINSLPGSTSQLKPETYRFLASNAAQGLGLRLPLGAAKPQALLNEERDQVKIDTAKKEITEAEKILASTSRSLDEAAREQQRLIDTIEDLNQTLQKLTTLGRQREAETIKEIEIPKAQRRKERAERRIPTLETQQTNASERLERAKQELRTLQGSPPETPPTTGGGIEEEEEEVGGGGGEGTTTP